MDYIVMASHPPPGDPSRHDVIWPAARPSRANPDASGVPATMAAWADRVFATGPTAASHQVAGPLASLDSESGSAFQGHTAASQETLKKAGSATLHYNQRPHLQSATPAVRVHGLEPRASTRDRQGGHASLEGNQASPRSFPGIMPVAGLRPIGGSGDALWPGGSGNAPPRRLARTPSSFGVYSAQACPDRIHFSRQNSDISLQGAAAEALLGVPAHHSGAHGRSSGVAGSPVAKAMLAAPFQQKAVYRLTIPQEEHIRALNADVNQEIHQMRLNGAGASSDALLAVSQNCVGPRMNTWDVSPGRGSGQSAPDSVIPKDFMSATGTHLVNTRCGSLKRDVSGDELDFEDLRMKLQFLETQRAKAAEHCQQFTDMLEASLVGATKAGSKHERHKSDTTGMVLEGSGSGCTEDQGGYESDRETFLARPRSSNSTPRRGRASLDERTEHGRQACAPSKKSMSRRKRAEKAPTF